MVTTMLMVIFGAGASYDCDPQHPAATSGGLGLSTYRLPLTNLLFSDRFGHILNGHNRCNALVPRLHLAAQANAVEQELEAIRDESHRPGSRLGPQLADVLYYIRDVIGWCTATWVEHNYSGLAGYAALLSYIEEWRAQQPENQRVCIVTFNYDTLLEQAFGRNEPKWRIEGIDDYVDGRPYQIIKLHGSINWWRVVAELDPARELDDYWSLRPTGEYVTQTERQRSSALLPMTPAIAIPMMTKGEEDFACPKRHLDVLRNCLMEVTHLLIVGWRGMEGHFMQLWRDIPRSADTITPQRIVRFTENWPPTLLAVQVVNYSSDSTTETCESIQRGGIRCDRVLPFLSGFSEFTTSPRHLQELLRIHA